MTGDPAGASPTPEGGTTTLGFSRGERVLLVVVGGVVGAGLGLALPYVAGALGAIGWLPFSGLLRDIGSYDAAWASAARPLGGIVLGVVFAAFVIHESPVVRVSEESLVITQRGGSRRVDRADVHGVYLDGSRTVVVSPTGRELFRGEIEGGRDRVRRAFVEHGYPWESL